MYFVGPPGNLPFAARLMPDWLHAGAPSKVPVWFLASFLDDDDGLEFLGDHRPIAWWALSSRFMFTLDQAHADRLKAAIREEMATRASFGTRRW